MRAVDGEHDVGSCTRQILIAAFLHCPAKIGYRQLLALEHGAHCAVQDQDALLQKFFESAVPLRQPGHDIT